MPIPVLTWRRRAYHDHGKGRVTYVYQCREHPRLMEFQETVDRRMIRQYWIIEEDPAGRSFVTLERAWEALSEMEG